MQNNTTLNPELTFATLLGKTKAFVSGEITQEVFDKWGQTLKIMNSLPLLLKTAIMMNLMRDYYYNAQAIPQESLTVQLYMNFFFHGYLGGYLGVTDIPANELTYENYDLLEPIFGPWIESFAQRDINNFKQMVFNNIQFYNSKLVSDGLELLDTDKIIEQTNTNKELIKYLQQDKDMVSQLNSISILNNPDLVKFVNDIQAKAAREAKQQ